MNILIIGAGGREHAMAWKVRQSPKLGALFVLPGNAGTAELAENVGEIAVDDHAAIVSFCKEKKIDLVIVGPEAPLAAGLADALSARGIGCFGPSQAAAQIEASKSFAKDFMARHNIPTARYATFSDFDSALQHLKEVDYPIVIKASGLAAGKGVILPQTAEEAKSALDDILTKKNFGETEAIIEERLTGEEVSLMAFTDGTFIAPMPPAQDHKRLLDGDCGPNTGGMGAYAPAPILTDAALNEALEKILRAAVDGMRSEGHPFVGVLYAGLMLTPSGLRVLEFNCRFGDPETQALLPLLETDLLEIAQACVDGNLASVDVRWKEGAAACIVLASHGYPENPETGKVISFEELPENTICFHAGTKSVGDKVLVSSGRVLGLTSWADNIESAIEAVYGNINKVSFEGMQYRKDISKRTLSRTHG
ncbi:MAG: phosphoribosylamine--glycine ligase [Anaerolineales bacterium]|nr:phosphoribosylamine--glycine ligase [Anaerolineales bacterium]